MTIRTTALTLSALAATTALTVNCTAAGADAPAPQPGAHPTVVLVHGAFADSSSWNGVIAELHRDGYPVVAVANPLRGLHTVEADASHAVTVSRPDVVADLIDDAARSTSR